MEILLCAELGVQENAQIARNVFKAICAKMFCKCEICAILPISGYLHISLDYHEMGHKI